MNQIAERFSRSPGTDGDVPLRCVTAASLFDGHDAAINLMRRLIQAEGCEVIHLGHNRSVAEIVRAAVCEDADAIAVSSYQGGHMEYFRYMVDMLREQGADHIQVFGGGGGTITPDEIRQLQDYGVNRIYHPDDGMRMGLKEMIGDLVARTRQARETRTVSDFRLPLSGDVDSSLIAAGLSVIENGGLSEHELAQLRKAAESSTGAPVIGLTGTGGAGKSSVTDELVNRFLQYFPEMRIAVLAVDPDTAAHRRRAARRSHPHELAALRAGVHALDGDPTATPGDLGGRGRLAGLAQDVRVRPGDPGNRWYRSI